jgi:TonB-linked SusC/RagA family outer membrane protein
MGKPIRYLFFLMSLLGVFNSSLAQRLMVAGIVIDPDTHLGMPGVSISLKSASASGDSTKATIIALGTTDRKGNFSVRAVKGATLKFSHIGFEDLFETVEGAKDDYVITMRVAVSTMKDVVVIGYKNVSRDKLTGSVVTISGKDLQDVPVGNVMQLLQGKVAGLNIQNNNGTPGMGGTIQLRGVSNVSITGSGTTAFLTPTSPLYVIDGVPVDINSNYQYGFQTSGPGIDPISLIPPEDIESIEVLKDAVSEAPYGSKGAYGVIIVTTKRGKSAVPIVSYSSQFFISTPPRLQKVIGGRDERTMRINEILQEDSSYADALRIIQQTPFLADSLNPYYNNSTNWQSYFYRTTSNQSHNLSISGGNDAFNYSINGNYYSQKGIIQNTGFTRYNLSMNMTYQPSQKFKLVPTVSTSLAKNSTGSGNSLLQTGVATAGLNSSLLPPPSLYTASNETLAALSVSDDNKTDNISPSVELDYEPLRGLRFSTTFGYSVGSATETKFSPSNLNAGFSQLYSYNSKSSTLYSRTSVSYAKTFNNKHDISLNIFNEINESDTKTNDVTQNGTPNDQVRGPLGYNWSTLGGVSSISQARSVGYSAAFSYAFETKYILSLSYRLDGTSSNGPNMPYVKDPAIGLRWNFSKEAFMKSFTWLDYAALHGSWGKTIVPTANIYNIYGQYNTNTLRYNNSPTVSIALGDVPNPNLVPQVTTTWDGGLEAGFFKSKLSVVFDTYYKQVDKQLSDKAISNIAGFTGVNTNETSVVDYGYEITLSLRPLSEKSKLKMTISLNGAVNKDVMAHLPDGVRQLALSGGNTSQPVLYHLGGNSLSNLLYNNTGVYATTGAVPVDPVTGLRYRIGGTSVSSGSYFKAGDPVWTDINGDYVLDANDLVIVGNSQPRFTGGGNVYLQYGNFSFNMNLSATIGRDIINDATADRFRDYYSPLATGALVPISGNIYQAGNTNHAVYPNPYDYTRSALIDPYRYNQTLFQEDGSYIKINNITISYNLNRNFTKRFGITSMRIYGTADNIHTFTHYSGPNPESVSGLGRDVSGGYPNARNYTFGLNVQF